jgi:hypothetical protein
MKIKYKLKPIPWVIADHAQKKAKPLIYGSDSTKK